MRDYYDILELPVTATPDEIRTKYRQLVRVYHPDRFANPVDKAYAEEKLKLLNEAYAALTATPLAPRFGEPVRARPAPVLAPELVEFGEVPHPRSMRALLHASNQGGPAQNIIVTYSSGQHWLTVSHDEPLIDDPAHPLEIEITVNTRGMEVGQQLVGWVEINLDGVAARSLVRMQVGQPVRQRISPLLIMVGGLLILLIIALSVVIMLLQ